MESVISVIITTRSRLLDLRRCLESIKRCQMLPGWRAEILVVDNGCSNDTHELVTSLSEPGGPIQFCYLSEPRRGKGFAVNHGVASAQGEILAFTDDDVIVDKKWITEIVTEFNDDPKLDLLAGRVEPVDCAAGRQVAVTRFAERTPLSGLLSLEGYVLGCNLAIRPSVLEKVRGRDTRLGPGRGLSCEDIDFAYRVLRSGHYGVFFPGPLVYHDPGQRDRACEYLRGWGAFYIKFVVIGDSRVTRQAWWRLCEIGAEFWRGGSDLRTTLNQFGHLLAGASIMLARMALSRPGYD
jgi:GT2 family glycosyltransferase